MDGPYRIVETAAGTRLSPDPADLPFVLFASEVGRRFGSVLLFARARGSQPAGRVLLPADVGVVALPHYDDLRKLHAVAGAAFGTAAAFWRGLDKLDTVWIFGPHPFGLLLLCLARLRRRKVVLGVRGETLDYFRARLPSGRWKPVLGLVRLMDHLYRVAARRFPTTVVGEPVARHYGGERESLLTMTVSLVRADELVSEPAQRDWGQVELLTVGRIDSEKNPLLLVRAIAELERRHPGRFRVTMVGEGPLEGEVRRLAEELGVAERIRLRGYVPFGGELLDLYREAHAFVHVSRTEGLPQVLIEALASALPTVATSVGGVSAALDGGRAGLLVPPDDLDALVEAVLRLSDDEALRKSIVARGLALARESTFESQSERVARFLMTGSSRE